MGQVKIKDREYAKESFMNRPNRPPTGSRPIVVHVRTVPAPQKAGKLPEWASFTTAVTGITIFAFAASSFYVFGLVLAIKEPLAIYFSPIDYLRITPSWAIPTPGIFALTLALSPGIFFHARFGVGFYVILWFLMVVLLVACLYVSLFMADTKLRGTLYVATWSLLALPILTFGVAFVPITRVVKVMFVMAASSIFFAHYLGSHYEPYAIRERPLSRVLFESEKDKVAAVEGKAIFDLERYLLLLTEDKTVKSVVAIPHEKIKSIQTPPLPVEQKPTPVVASTTPAETSPRATETSHVSPSPVQSPTATAEPQKK
jgi:hypothetical protein